MKNIHVLTTEKFSNLILQTNGELRLSELEFRGQVGNGFTQNIYITSDEEIKEGDWFAVELFKITGESRGLHIEKCIKLNDIWCNDFDVVSTRHKGNCNKIILTTDQDLIKDGVQAIDDDFLEWFVKNPSCEFVEVVDDWNSPRIDAYEYKIIIPKEEPKPNSFCETPEENCTMNYCDDNGCQNRKRELVEPKQERMYSEEKIDKILQKLEEIKIMINIR